MGLLLGHCRNELRLPRPTCWLLQAPPTEERSPLKSPLLSPWCKVRVGAPTKPPMILGAGRALGSLFLLEQPETQEVVLPWPGGGAVWSARCCFSGLPAPSRGLHGAGCGSASPSPLQNSPRGVLFWKSC